MAPELSGAPVVTDFGQMRPMLTLSTDWWMPDLDRAPEILLKLPWWFPVDVWSVGVMMLELLEGRNLFDPIDRANNHYVLPLALAQYIAYLGPPPLAIVEQVTGHPNHQSPTHHSKTLSPLSLRAKKRKRS
ncbi:hypothetical protein Z517_09466 [Fonsecaea pedrosoi CBS 271.37]|uniref:Unplaced genomic scaffold supercont1.6, whole genome shotgun sequence n=1 Tax=Fonsecaea pedrosoi CBS 271.37 TaxID=1442368 RepID=A0A0D2GEK4_9EURO|nr:uncharacterized protein Z517_09466 [Fonsecaea pedrosoi CBS 271.37]KIW77020.1 hypothetical protein Z517_09466 [Fonsecaea pedrosoi CBS 271.37]